MEKGIWGQKRINLFPQIARTTALESENTKPEAARLLYLKQAGIRRGSKLGTH